MFEINIPSLFFLASSRVQIESSDVDLLKTLPKNLKDKLRQCSTKPGCGVQLKPDYLRALLHPDVRDLHLTDCSGEHLMCLEASPGLHKLNLNSAANFIDCAQPLESALRCLPHLRILYLRQNFVSVTDRHLWTMAECCPLLLELDLGDCTNVTDEGIAGRRYQSVTESRRENVTNVGRLHKNDEEGNNVAGCRLERGLGIASLSRLHSLNLSRTSISDSGLEALGSGPIHDSLCELRVDRCFGISDDGIEAILVCCDKLTIFIFHSCPKLTERSREALENFLLEHQIQMKQTTFTIY